MDLALVMSGDLDPGELRGYIEDRIRVLAAQAAFHTHQGERAWPDQTAADDLVVEHARLRIEAELAWHRMVLDQAGKLARRVMTVQPIRLLGDPVLRTACDPVTGFGPSRGPGPAGGRPASTPSRNRAGPGWPPTRSASAWPSSPTTWTASSAT